MVETRVFCDSCSERITQDRTLLKVACGPERLRRPTVDLCSTCLASFVATLDTTVSGDTQPVPRMSQANRTEADPAPPRRVAVPRTESHAGVVVVSRGD